jgi:glycosyltransferase involved in cell wall biosynthesis
VKLSVVIPCLNGEKTLPELFDALAAQEWEGEWEIVLADNGSTDGTREVVERYRSGPLPNLRVADASSQRGQSFAMNVGAAEAKGEWLAFCDADDVVGDNWLPAVTDALGRHELIAYRQDDTRLNPLWAQASREKIFTDELPKTWFPPYVPFTGAGCMAMHRSVFESIGGFDPEMPLEDLDFSIRAFHDERELVLVPGAVLHYRYRQSYKGIFRQAYIYGLGFAAVQRKYKRPGERYPKQRLWLITGWRVMLPRLIRAYDRGDRAKIAWQLGWQAGRYHGSFKYRVLAV